MRRAETDKKRVSWGLSFIPKLMGNNEWEWWIGAGRWWSTRAMAGDADGLAAGEDAGDADGESGKVLEDARPGWF